MPTSEGSIGLPDKQAGRKFILFNKTRAGLLMFFGEESKHKWIKQLVGIDEQTLSSVKKTPLPNGELAPGVFISSYFKQFPFSLQFASFSRAGLINQISLPQLG